MKADAKLVGLSELRLSLDNQTTCESAAESQIPPPSAPTPTRRFPVRPFPLPCSGHRASKSRKPTGTPWGYVPTLQTDHLMMGLVTRLPFVMDDRGTTTPDLSFC